MGSAVIDCLDMLVGHPSKQTPAATGKSFFSTVDRHLHIFGADYVLRLDEAAEAENEVRTQIQCVVHCLQRTGRVPITLSIR